MNLSAKLGLDTSDFVSGLKKTQEQSVSSFTRMQREVERLQAANDKMIKNA